MHYFVIKTILRWIRTRWKIDKKSYTNVSAKVFGFKISEKKNFFATVSKDCSQHQSLRFLISRINFQPCDILFWNGMKKPQVA